MKSVELRTEDIAAAYGILSVARYQKLADDDKVRVWKISRHLCPIAEKYAKDDEDARKKLLPSEDFPLKLQTALQYQNIKEAGGDDLPMSEEEYKKTVEEWNSYNNLLNKAIKELADEKVSFEIDPITEDAFGKLMASNDWSFAQVGKLEFMIV